MKKLICIFAILFLIFDFALAQGIPSNELIKNAKLYDGKAISYKGEVIGDVMRRGDFAWVNLHDGTNAIGIWAPLTFTKDIVYTGSYKAKGDILEVTGIFNRACPEHGGDLDIHAQILRKIDSGRLVSEKLNPAKVNQALILLGVLLSVWILTLFLRK
ncbi:MAG: DNA-binding protein [Candidatus Omnitrophota bacterium]